MLHKSPAAALPPLLRVLIKHLGGYEKCEYQETLDNNDVVDHMDFPILGSPMH